MFGAAPDERAYTLDTDEQGRTWVRVRRRRARRAAAERHEQRARDLPQGARRRRAMSRADKLTQLTTRPLGLKGVSNPLPAAGRHRPGAADAGARDHAARHAHARPRGVAARLRGLRARLRRHRQGAGRRCCSCPPGRSIAITIAGPGRTVRRCRPQPGVDQPAGGAAGQRRSARAVRAARAPAEHLPPRTQGQARSRLRQPQRARRGGSGAARALRASTRARSRSRCSSPT